MLKRIKGVLAIPPQASDRARAFAGARELSGEQLEVFRRSGWRFLATEEFDSAGEEGEANAIREIPPERPSSTAGPSRDADAPARRVYRNSDGRVVIEGASIVVKFRPDAEPGQINALLDAHGLDVQSVIGFVRNGYQVKPRNADADLLEVAERLQAEEAVDYAEPSQVEAIESR